LVELGKEYKDFDKDEDTASLGWKERLKRLLYIFSGSDLESEEFEHIIEEEPSVKSFKEYFEKIRNDLKSEGLIIVFDNMDRLSNSKKVLSLWSSIHTFFAEENAKNIWILIPYDKYHLASHFNGGSLDVDKLENFIGKTFSTVFRVSPPVLSDWKKFFTLKLKEAFENIIANDEIEFVASLYELVVNVGNRKPRDIITFINNLVSLYHQHGQSIEIKYLALFALRSNQILDNPLVSISSKQFIKEEKYIFSDSAALEANIAAIVYNVDVAKSGEVLLKNNIEEMFIRYDAKTLESIKQHHEFPTYFDKVFQKENLATFKSENITSILDEIKDVVSETSAKRYWEKFSSDIRNKEDDSFDTFEEWHKKTIRNISKKSCKVLCDRIASASFGKFKNSNKSEDSDGSDYYWLLFELIKFLNENEIGVTVNVKPITFTPGQLFYYLDDIHREFKPEVCEYKDLKIKADPKELHSYLTEKNSGIELWHSYLHVIKFLVGNEKTFKVNSFKEHVEEIFVGIGYNKKEDIKKFIKVLKTLSGKKEIKVLPENTCTNFLETYGGSTEDPYFDIICSHIAHLNTTKTPSNTYLIQELNKQDNVDEISSLIQYYTSFGDILKLSVLETNKKYPLLKGIAKKLNENDYGFVQSLDISWIYKNIEKINEVVFSESMNDFLTHFDSWSEHFSKYINSDTVFDLGRGYINLSGDSENHRFISVKHFYDSAIEKFTNLDSKDWLDHFDSDSNLFLTFVGYVNAGLLGKAITKSNQFMEAYEAFMKSIAKRNNPLPDNAEIWDWISMGDYLDNRKQKRLFNDFLDLILDHTEITPEEVDFFGSGMLRHSSNLTNDPRKASEFIRKAIIPLENDMDVLKNLVDNSFDQLVNVLLTTEDYRQDLVELFMNARENEFLEVETYERLLKETKLKKIENSVAKKKEDSDNH
jgi:hypothetical protein